jgi:hypothetical protein
MYFYLDALAETAAAGHQRFLRETLAGEETHLLLSNLSIMHKRSFYQDRLGTNIGET